MLLENMEQCIVLAVGLLKKVFFYENDKKKTWTHKINIAIVELFFTEYFSLFKDIKYKLIAHFLRIIQQLIYVTMLSDNIVWLNYIKQMLEGWSH